MNFQRLHNGKIIISTSSLQKLKRYRQTKIKHVEAGGVLLGRLSREGSDIIIDDITVPGEGDIASRFSFNREKKRTQYLVNKAWHESEGTKNYLGEWHTHPENIPNPSPQDLTNWHYISTNAQYEQDSLIFIIVGIDQIRVWELYKITNKLVENIELT